MKVVGIISSPLINGSTAVLVRSALRGAAQQGAEIEEVHLMSQDLSFCRGCMQCLAKGKCALNDKLEEIRQKMLDADGIILGSPTYGLEPNAIMKNFLDRIGLFSAYTSSLGGKYFAGISTAGAMGARSVSRKLVGIANGCFRRGFVSGTLGVSVGWKSIDDFPQYKARAHTLGARMAEDIRSARTHPFQNIMPRLINRLIVRSAMRNNIRPRKDGAMQAVYLNLQSRGLW